jgi:hypothetical protein
MDPLTKNLQQARNAWDDEVRRLEAEIQPKLERIRFLREQLSSADRLLSGLNGGNGSVPKAAPGLVKPIETSPGSTRRGFTPTDAYWVPILESLVELGGSGVVSEILRKVEQKMRHILTAADREKNPGSTQIRWENRAEWQRFNMVKAGLLGATSPRGRWEITADGREWLTKHGTNGLR